MKWDTLVLLASPTCACVRLRLLRWLKRKLMPLSIAVQGTRATRSLV
jgi:hypothetical protein